MTKSALIPALALLCAASACTKSPTPQATAEPAAVQAKEQAAASRARQGPVAAGDVTRIPAAEVQQRVQTGQALLICAYASDDKFAKMALQGAIPRSSFEAQLPRTPKNKQLIFYCA